MITNKKARRNLNIAAAVLAIVMIVGMLLLYAAPFLTR